MNPVLNLAPLLAVAIGMSAFCRTASSDDRSGLYLLPAPEVRLARPAEKKDFLEISFPEFSTIAQVNAKTDEVETTIVLATAFQSFPLKHLRFFTLDGKPVVSSDAVKRIGEGPTPVLIVLQQTEKKDGAPFFDKRFAVLFKDSVLVIAVPGLPPFRPVPSQSDFQE